LHIRNPIPSHKLLRSATLEAIAKAHVYFILIHHLRWWEWTGRARYRYGAMLEREINATCFCGT